MAPKDKDPIPVESEDEESMDFDYDADAGAETGTEAEADAGGELAAELSQGRGSWEGSYIVQADIDALPISGIFLHRSEHSQRGGALRDLFEPNLLHRRIKRSSRSNLRTRWSSTMMPTLRLAPAPN